MQGLIGCKIHALEIDCAFTCHPVPESSFLYGGCPCTELRHKFLMAQELTKKSLPEGFEITLCRVISLDMVGFRTPDDAIYLGDCLSIRETLDKYQIGFIYDVAACLNTLKMVKSLWAKMFVPAHAAASEDITHLGQHKIDKVLEIGEKITGICQEPLCFETIFQRLFTDYGLTINFEQYVLVGSTVRSYLAWLKDIGRVSTLFENNMPLWQQV